MHHIIVKLDLFTHVNHQNDQNFGQNYKKMLHKELPIFLKSFKKLMNFNSFLASSGLRLYRYNGIWGAPNMSTYTPSWEYCEGRGNRGEPGTLETSKEKNGLQAGPDVYLGG